MRNCAVESLYTFVYDPYRCVPNPPLFGPDLRGAFPQQLPIFLEVREVGYGRVSPAPCWILWSNWGADWRKYDGASSGSSVNSSYNVGDGDGCIRGALTSDDVGACGVCVQPALAPNLGFVHVPSPLSNVP